MIGTRSGCFNKGAGTDQMNQRRYMMICGASRGTPWNSGYSGQAIRSAVLLYRGGVLRALEGKMILTLCLKALFSVERSENISHESDNID